MLYGEILNNRCFVVRTVQNTEESKFLLFNLGEKVLPLGLKHGVMFCLLCYKPATRSASFLQSVVRYICRMLVIAMYIVSSDAFGCSSSASVCHK